MKGARLFLIGLFAAILPALMAPTGGYPSNPTFQTVTVNGTSTTGRAHVCNTAATATNKCMGIDVNTSGGFEIFVENDTHGGVSNALTINRSGAVATGMTFTTASGAADLTATDSGAVTWSLQTGTSNCTVNGTNATVQLHRIGKNVTGTITAAGNCTIASGTQVATTNTPVPAAFRPAASSQCGVALVNVPGVVVGWICVTSAGNLSANNTSAVTTLGPQGSSFSYTLD